MAVAKTLVIGSVSVWLFVTVLGDPSCSEDGTGAGGTGECAAGGRIPGVIIPGSLSVDGVVEVVDVDTAHRARFAIMNQLLFPTRKEAQNALADLRYRYRTFQQIADDLNRRAALVRQPSVSGDMGLVAYDDVEPEVAKIAFDVRQPLSTHDGHINGPVCVPDKGCYLFSVFNRFRRNFFSDAWYDVEAYAKNEGVKFGEFLDGVNGDAAKHLAWVVWPYEDVNGRKQRIEDLKGDLQRVAKQDWSAQPEVETKEIRVHRLLQSQDLTAHHSLMAQKERLYKRIPAQTFAEHPEIYGMDIEDIVAAGYATLPEGDSEEAPPLVGPTESEPTPPQSTAGVQAAQGSTDEL